MARLGGDEFCLLLEDWIDIPSIELVASKILTALASPFSILDQTVQISASIGIALFPQDASTPEDMINKADLAMYRAKLAGRNQLRFFSPLDDTLFWALVANVETAQIEDVNPFLINMLGYSYDEFLGKKLWEIGAFRDTALSIDM